MSRMFYLIGTAFLAIALVLSFIASISLPYLSALDFARATAGPQTAFGAGTNIVRQIRWGIWGYCFSDVNNNEHCIHTGHGYSLDIITSENQGIVIGASWTRGLAIHPVATGVIAIALGFAASKHEHGPLIASLTSFFAALMLLIAFAIDIALFANIHHLFGTLKNTSSNVNTGAAFWMTFVELIFVLLAGCTVCFGRRKDGGSDSYPMFTNPSGGFLSRFRK